MSKTSLRLGAIEQRLFETFVLSRACAPSAIVSEYGPWYMNRLIQTHDIASTYRRSHTTVAGVIAALSPLLRWENNIPAAIEVLEERVVTAHSIAGYLTPHLKAEHGGYLQVLPQSISKALQILADDSPWPTLHYGPASGHKTYSFAHNILWPDTSSHATCDAWIDRVGGVEAGVGKQVVYHVRESALRRAAAVHGESVSKCQAIIWGFARDYMQLEKGEWLAIGPDGYLTRCGSSAWIDPIA